MEAALGELRSDSTTHRRRHGAGIHHHCPLLGLRRDAVLAENQLFRHLAVADAQEHALGIRRGISWRRAESPARRTGQFARLCGRVRPNAYVMTSLYKIPSHGVAHDAQSKRSEFRHAFLLKSVMERTIVC